MQSKLLLPALSIAATLSTSPAVAQSRDQILTATNTLLSYWNHTVDYGDKSTLSASLWRFHYIHENKSMSWCRGYQWEFHGIDANASMCFSTESSSHELAYSIVNRENLELQMWFWVTEYSDNELITSYSISHPNIGAYSQSVSYDIGDILYDPFISASVHTNYPISRDTSLYGDAKWRYGMYSYSWNLEIWVQHDLWDVSIHWWLWMNTFKFHASDIRADTLNMFLEEQTGYISWGVEYCLIDNVCWDISLNHSFDWPSKWNSDVSFWLHLSH